MATTYAVKYRNIHTIRINDSNPIDPVIGIDLA